MKPEKTSGGNRLLSFMLTLILLLFALGFAVSAWQEPQNAPEENENAPPSNNENQENGENQEENLEKPDDGEENPENGEENSEPPPIIEVPKYYHSLTGLEILESELQKAALGYVVSSSTPLYGISNADLTIEFPTEDGSTRLLTYTTNDALLWKVGSLAPSRSFISSMSNFFGGIIVSYGNDDIIEYGFDDSANSSVDISKHSDCYYIENASFIYTSKEKTNELILRNGLSFSPGYKSAPFKFAPIGESTAGLTPAQSVTLPYTDSKKTEFVYSESSGQYLYFKDGRRKVDMLNGKNVAFTNVFVLFANATTYEKSEGVEMVIDTVSGGKGYYLSGGTLTEIYWSVTFEGNLEFRTLNGEILTVNRGNSYIGYYKASQMSNVVFN